MRRARVDQLLSAQKRLEDYLKAKLRVTSHINFGQLVTRAEAHGLINPEQLRLIRLAAEIRNIVVHEGTPTDRVIAPTTRTVRRLEMVVATVTSPPLSIPTFEREVEVLQDNKPLSDVLRLIAQRDFSQFPVYRSGRFRGLLTENGITRWLSSHVTGKGSVVCFDATRAGELLQCEESDSGAAEFAASDEPVRAIAIRFQRNPLLEAVLITRNGARNEVLLGIATRWDIARLPGA